jgi:hypothetical protein
MAQRDSGQTSQATGVKNGFETGLINVSMSLLPTQTSVTDSAHFFNAGNQCDLADWKSKILVGFIIETDFITSCGQQLLFTIC